MNIISKLLILCVFIYSVSGNGQAMSFNPQTGLTDCQTVSECTKKLATGYRKENVIFENNSRRVIQLQRYIYKGWLKSLPGKIKIQSHVKYNTVHGPKKTNIVKFAEELRKVMMEEVSVGYLNTDAEYHNCQSVNTEEMDCSVRGVFDNRNLSCEAPLAFAFVDPANQIEKSIYLCHRYFSKKFSFEDQAIILLHEYLHHLGIDHTAAGEAEIQKLLYFIVPDCNKVKKVTKDRGKLCQ